MVIKDNVLVSIIVPVYNAENYLEKCLDSLINQTMSNIEIIAINDGSCDNSLEILKSYSKNDSRIRIINQKNSGVSAARNRGINEAIGKYITFVDSDDWIENNLIEELFKANETNNTAISKCDLFIVTQDGTNVLDYQNNDSQIYSANNVISQIFKVYGEKHFGYAHCKLYSTTLIKENNLKFNTDMEYAEDVIFLIKAVKAAGKVCYVPKQLYHYNVNTETSLTRGYIRDFKGKLDLLYSRIQEELNDNVIKEQVREDFSLYKFNGFISLLQNKEKQNKKSYSIIKGIRKDILVFLKKYPDIVQVDGKKLTFKRRIILFLIKKRLYSLTAFISA